MLDARKSKYPAGRSRTDADPALATRIAGVLSARGLGDRDLVKRALTEGSGTCDTEDQCVRAEALNALRQTDPDEALAQAKKILGRKDDCSVQLRRSALWMIANKKDAAAHGDARERREDRSVVRICAPKRPGSSASMGNDEALSALEELVKSDDDRVQRAAVRALTMFPNPRARTAMRALIENNGASEQLRITALDAFDRDRSTLDDASWLRSIYPKVESARVKARIVVRRGAHRRRPERAVAALAREERGRVHRRAPERPALRGAHGRHRQPQQVLRRGLGAAAARGDHQRARQPQGTGGHGQADRHRAGAAPIRRCAATRSTR